MTELNDIEGLTPEQKKAVESLIEESVAHAVAHYLQVDAERVIPLSEYRQGDVVKVLAVSRGSWVPGNVSEIGPWGISVDTERGPVTIATTDRIHRA